MGFPCANGISFRESFALPAATATQARLYGEGGIAPQSFVGNEKCCRRDDGRGATLAIRDLLILQFLTSSVTRFRRFCFAGNRVGACHLPHKAAPYRRSGEGFLQPACAPLPSLRGKSFPVVRNLPRVPGPWSPVPCPFPCSVSQRFCIKISTQHSSNCRNFQTSPERLIFEQSVL